LPTLGDRALAALLPGGVLRGDEPDEGHQLLRAAEAAEVADLGDERERGQRVDAAQAAQPGDELPPRLLLGRLADRPLERLDPCVDEVEGVQVCVEGELLGDELEALLGEPLAPHHAPGQARQQAPVAQAELREPMPVAHPIEARVLAGADEVAGRLQLGRGDVDRLQQSAGEQAGELTRVARVGLDPVARPLRTAQSIPRSTRWR
jgi:hypothetical protein